MTCRPHAFGFACSDIEESWWAHLSTLQAQEQAELERTEDMAERLVGPCERCQEPQGDVLVVVSGEALCDGCLHEERMQ